MVQQRPKAAKAARWRDYSFKTSDGGGLGKRLPTNAVPTVAQLGMIVLPSGGGDYAVIVDMTQETCTVRWEDGTLDVLRWGEVSLEHVGPPASARQLDTLIKSAVAPG